jgi:CheY-like chemotaxis protein
MTRIAVVDDDLEFVALLRKGFRDQGWDTVEFGKRIGVVNSLVHVHPDAIVVELRMERPDAGWTLIHLLREGLHSVRDVPIVVCSGDATRIRERYPWLRQHGIPVVEKPFELDVMIGVIGDLLVRKAS